MQSFLPALTGLCGSSLYLSCSHHDWVAPIRQDRLSRQTKVMHWEGLGKLPVGLPPEPQRPIRQILQMLLYRTAQCTSLHSSSRDSTLPWCQLVFCINLLDMAGGKGSSSGLWQVHRSYAPKAVVLGSAAAMGPAAVPFEAPTPPAVLGADTSVHCAMLRLGWFSVKVAASAMGPLRQCIHTSAQPGPALENGMALTNFRS